MTKLTNYYFTSSSQLKVKLISWFVHSNSTHLQTEPSREILGLRREKGISIRKWAELTTYVTDAQGSLAQGNAHDDDYRERSKKFRGTSFHTYFM